MHFHYIFLGFKVLIECTIDISLLCAALSGEIQYEDPCDFNRQSLLHTDGSERESLGWRLYTPSRPSRPEVCNRNNPSRALSIRSGQKYYHGLTHTSRFMESQDSPENKKQKPLYTLINFTVNQSTTTFCEHLVIILKKN